MELYGGLVRNLEATIESAEQLRGRPVHELTLRYWRDLIEYARYESRDRAPPRLDDDLITRLRRELAEHEALVGLAHAS
jgi:hypothetical protein